MEKCTKSQTVAKTFLPSCLRNIGMLSKYFVSYRKFMPYVNGKPITLENSKIHKTEPIMQTLAVQIYLIYSIKWGIFVSTRYWQIILYDLDYWIIKKKN